MIPEYTMDKLSYSVMISRLCLVLTGMLLCSVDMLAQHSWRWLSYNSTRKDQYAVAISTDNRHAATVGVGGSMFVTSDSSVTWEPREVRVMEGFTSAAYSSDSTLIVTAGVGAVYRSEDHFRTWTRIVVNAQDSLTCVRRLSKGVLLCTGRNGTVYRSTDAGKSWTSVLAALPVALYHIACAPDGRAMAVGGRGVVMLSRDGGSTWTQASMQAPDSVTLMRVCYVNDSVWVIAGNVSYLARTTDDGRAWERKEPIPARAGRRFWIRSLAFTSDGSGVMIDDNMYDPKATISITRDGGATWSPGYVGSAPWLEEIMMLYLFDLSFWPNSKRAVVAGMREFVHDFELIQGMFSKHYEYNVRVEGSYDEQRRPIFLKQASAQTYFVCKDSARVQMLTEYDSQTDRLIRRWRNSDSSGSWNSSTRTSSALQYDNAYKPSDSTVVIIADSSVEDGTELQSFGRILTTTDGGRTWHRSETSSTLIGEWQAGLWRSSRSGALHVVARKLLLTDDGGITWRSVSYPAGYRDFTLAFVSADSLSYLVFARDTIGGRTDLLRLRSDDTWQEILSDVPVDKFAVRDGTFSVLFSTTDRSHLLTEHDGSAARVVRVADSKGEDTDYRAKACFVGNVLVALRPTLNVHISRDSGRTFTDAVRDPVLTYLDTPWNPQYSFITAFSVNNTLLFSRSDGLSLACVIDQTTNVDEEATDIFTYPPYPNPFTSRVRIDVAWYLTVAPESVTLHVYDALGRHVRDLTQQLRTAALRHSSSVLFDASDLPPGIYFIVSRARGQTSTRQVLLQR
jgi:photosystem II stability/assembly factor-like uncharacterized protein